MIILQPALPIKKKLHLFRDQIPKIVCLTLLHCKPEETFLFATLSYRVISALKIPITLASAPLGQIWSYFRSKSATSARKGCVV